MPIRDVELVLSQGEELPVDLALQLAQAAAEALRSEPAPTWARLRTIAADRYAEGDGGSGPREGPGFVAVLKAELSVQGELKEIADRLSTGIAELCERPAENVHVLFRPPAAGRFWSGGTQVRRG